MMANLFRLVTRVFLCMQITNSVVVAGLNYGFLTAGAIGVMYRKTYIKSNPIFCSSVWRAYNNKGRCLMTANLFRMATRVFLCMQISNYVVVAGLFYGFLIAGAIGVMSRKTYTKESQIQSSARPF